jgi:hypothetical protein
MVDDVCDVATIVPLSQNSLAMNFELFLHVLCAPLRENFSRILTVSQPTITFAKIEK